MREWDAASYQRVSGPQEAWGRAVVDGIELAGDERALDAGCGTGRVTRYLADRLPRGTLVAVDGSQAMVAEARARLADLADHVRVEHQDLLELRVEQPVDLIISTATFHWIADHAALFGRLHDALAPGGRLVAQCGGAGNIAATLAAADAVAATAPFAEHLSEVARPVHFADAPATARLLSDAGFEDVETWLHRAPTDVGGGEEGVAFLSTVVLRTDLARLPVHLQMPFAAEVADRLRDDAGHVQVDYVRLELRAHRPGGGGRPPGR